MNPIEREFLRVLGKNVEAIAIEGRAPTLVYLHEGLGSAMQWRELPERVAKETGRAAFAYSRLGYGASDPVTLPRALGYMEDEAKEFLPKVLDAAGIEETILVGHSDGASIAIVHAALDLGKRVKALVLEAPHVFVEDVSIASIEKAREAYAKGDLARKLAKHHAHADVAFRGWNDAWLDPGFRAWNIERYLSAIEIPVLVLQGDEDPYGTVAQVDAIAKQVKGRVETVILPGCGHAPHRDQFEKTASAVIAFVRSIVP
jgi:pimeloyl-ACP methyl ester carboxylesterase